eukprot:269534_1
MSQGGQRSSHIPHLVCNYPNHPNESRSHLRIAPQDPQISSYQKQHVNPFHNQYQTLHNKCEEYKQTIHRLQHHNQSLNTQCVDYKNEIQRLQRNNQTLTTHCHQSQGEIHRYKAAANHYELTMNTLTHQVSESQKKLKEWSDKYISDKQSLTRLQDELQRLKRHNLVLNKQCHESHAQIREWHSSERDYKAKSNRLTQRVSETDNKLKEWSDKHIVYKTDMRLLQDSIKKYKATESEYQSLLKRSRSKCNDLQRKCTTTQSAYKLLYIQYTALEAQHTRYKQRMEPFVLAQKMWSFAFRNKMHILMQSMTQWHAKYETSLRDLVDKYRALYGLCKLYRQQLNALKHGYGSLNAKYQSVLHECLRLKEQYGSLRNQHRTLFAESDHYKNKMNEYKKAFEALHTQKNESEVLLDQIIDEYPFVIRNTLFTQIKTPPSTHFQDKAFSMIQVILFEHPKYLYHEDQIWILFDMIWTHLGADCKHYKMKQCVLAIKAVKQCIGDLDASNNPKRLTLQQMQAIVASLMYIADGELLNKELFQQLLPQTKNHRADCISDCFDRRQTFDRRQALDICKDYRNEKRSSRMYICVCATPRLF